MAAPPGPDRRIFRSASTLALAVFGGLAVGALLGLEEGAGRLAIPALALQTFLTVGAMPRRRGAAGLRGAGVLLALHLTVASLPLAGVALLVGLDDPLGFGLFLIAIAPPGALVPAFAARLELDVRKVLVFCLGAYGLSLVLTPALLILVAGSTVGVAAIATTVGAGLIAPSLLGRACHERIVRLSVPVRQRIVNVTVFLISLGLGGDLLEGLSSAGIGLAGFALVALALIARSFGAGWLAVRVAPAEQAAEAPLAVGFKNLALAAAVGGALVGPVAAVPGLLGFFVETAYFLVLAWRRPAAAAAAAALAGAPRALPAEGH